MRSGSSLLIVLLCTVTAVPTGAASAMPEPGTRIRLTARMPERGRWIGPFVSVANDTVTMRDGEMNNALVTVPALHVMRFEISRGKHPNGLRGAGLGLALGPLLGAGVGYASYSGNGGNDGYLVSSAGESAAVGAAVFGIIGVAVGAAIGALTHSERWRALPLENLRSAARP
jgi:hypothetical protein